MSVHVYTDLQIEKNELQWEYRNQMMFFVCFSHRSRALQIHPVGPYGVKIHLPCGHSEALRRELVQQKN